jgi:hypothetical protein
MSDCSQHKKDVAGIEDMKVLAEIIGDLHYETLAELIHSLAKKIEKDGVKDFRNRRTDLASELYQTCYLLFQASRHVKKAYAISKPFMDKN